MALVVKDRVQQTSTTVGTGTYTLSGSVTGYQDFSAIGNANTTYYAATNGTDWEVGLGTYTLSGTTLSRDTILASSNSGNAVNWGAGVKSVFVTYPAGKSVLDGGTYSLNINGTVGATTPNTGAFTTLSASGVASFSAGSNSAPSIVRSTDPDTGIYWPTTNNIALATNGVNRFQIDSTGNVGVGSVDPNIKFNIAGNAPILRVLANTGNYNSYLVLSSTAAPASSSHYIDSLADTEFSYADLSIRAENIIFSGLSGERARFTTTGNFGLGTASPTNILSLGGDSARIFWMERHTTANTAGNNLTVQSGGATSGATDKNGGNLVLSSGTSTGTGSSQIIFNTAAAGTTGTTDRSPAERMRIDGSGNVGIGVTNPEFKLVVSQATTYNTTGLAKENNVFHFISESACNGWLEAYGTGASVLNGRVAGGTSTTPSAIAADRAMMTIGARGYGTSQWSALAVGLFGIYAAETFTNTANGTYIAFSTTPLGSVTRAERMRITAAGDVGVGTASPAIPTAGQTSFTVCGSTGRGNIYLTTAAADAAGVVVGSVAWQGGASTSGVVGDGRTAGIFSVTEGTTANNRGGTLQFNTKPDNGAFTERMRIDSTGNVGIGTAAPATKLDVAGQICGAYNNTTGVANTVAQALGTNTMSMVLISANTTLTSTVPPAGARATVIIKTSGATSRTVTFGTGFKSQGTLATGNTADRFWAVNFISDGTFLYEVGRTTTAYA